MFGFLKVVELAASMIRSHESSSLEAPEHTPDTVPECQREMVDGLVVSHYPDGTVRKENLISGVIQEERGDGSLLVSLPHGKVINQRYEGETFLVLDPENPGPPLLGRVGYLSIEGTRRLVYHYDDPQAHHIVEVSTLRYFKGKSPRIRRSEALLPAWQAVAC